MFKETAPTMHSARMPLFSMMSRQPPLQDMIHYRTPVLSKRFIHLPDGTTGWILPKGRYVWDGVAASLPDPQWFRPPGMCDLLQSQWAGLTWKPTGYCRNDSVWLWRLGLWGTLVVTLWGHLGSPACQPPGGHTGSRPSCLSCWHHDCNCTKDPWPEPPS